MIVSFGHASVQVNLVCGNNRKTGFLAKYHRQHFIENSASQEKRFFNVKKAKE